MKKISLIIALMASVCLTGLFANVTVAKNTASRQAKVQPFCKLTYIDHRGHSLKLSTNIMHYTNKNLTFIFDGGEKLILNFTTVRPGHFVAESARSKDPQIIFYPSHQNHAVPMVGAIIIATSKPVSGSFSHLVSDDDDDHLTLVAGTFSF